MGFREIAANMEKVQRLDAARAASAPPPPPQERSSLGEIFTGAKRSAFQVLPEMAGKALQYPKSLMDVAGYESPVTNALASGGTSLREGAEAIRQGIDTGALPELAPSSKADISKNPITGVLTLGAENLAPTAVGLIPGVGLASMIGLYGASQGQETLEKGIEEGINPSKAAAASLLTGAIQGGGEGLALKLFNPALKGINAFMKAGAEGAAKTTGEAVVSGIRQWGKSLPTSFAGEIGTEIAQDVATKATEQGVGIKDTGAGYLETAKGSALGAIGQTALLAPFGLAGHTASEVRKKNLAEQIETNQRALDALHQRVANPDAGGVLDVLSDNVKAEFTPVAFAGTNARQLLGGIQAPASPIMDSEAATPEDQAALAQRQEEVNTRIDSMLGDVIPGREEATPVPENHEYTNQINAVPALSDSMLAINLESVNNQLVAASTPSRAAYRDALVAEQQRRAQPPTTIPTLQELTSQLDTLNPAVMAGDPQGVESAARLRTEVDRRQAEYDALTTQVMPMLTEALQRNEIDQTDMTTQILGLSYDDLQSLHTTHPGGVFNTPLATLAQTPGLDSTATDMLTILGDRHTTLREFLQVQEPAPTEPAPTEPAPTEPAPTEPAPTEPAPTEPAPTEPAPQVPAWLTQNPTAGLFSDQELTSWYNIPETDRLRLRSEVVNEAGTAYDASVASHRMNIRREVIRRYQERTPAPLTTFVREILDSPDLTNREASVLAHEDLNDITHNHPSPTVRDRIFAIQSNLVGGNTLAEAFGETVTSTPLVEPVTTTTPNQELRNIVTRPVTSEEVALHTEVVSTLNAASLHPVRTELDQSLESIWGRIKTKTPFRWGGSNKDSFAGIANDLNRKLREVGSSVEVRFAVRFDGDTADRINPRKPRAGSYPQVYRLQPQARPNTATENWVPLGQFTPGGYFMQARIGLPNRGAQFGGLGYFMGQLAARNILGVSIRSGGMTPINQQRRAENAFSFLARFGRESLDDASMVFNDNRNTGRNQNLFAFLAGRTYANPATSYTQTESARFARVNQMLTRFNYDFETKQVKDKETSTVMPVRYISAFLRNQLKDNRGYAHRLTQDESQLQIGDSQNPYDAISDMTVTRAIINQTIVERLNRATDKTRETNKIIREIGRGGLQFPTGLLYNRASDYEVSGLKAGALSEDLASVVSGLKDIVGVEIVQSMSDVPGTNPDSPIFNAAYHEGKIYVVTDYVSNAKEASTLIIDHELRHAGLRKLLNDAQLDTFLKRAYFSHQKEVLALANQLNIDTSTAEGRLEAAEEYVVSLAQSAKESPFLDRAVTLIRQLLRKLGFNVSMSTSELRSLIAKAGDVKRLGKLWTQATPETRYSQSTSEVMDDTNTSLNKLGKQFNTVMKDITKGVVNMFSPQNRLVDLALSKPEFQIIKDQLRNLLRFRHEMSSIHSGILSDGQLHHDKIMEALNSQSEVAGFNKLMELGTVYGIYAYKEAGHKDQDWNAKTWADAKMVEQTGLTYSGAYQKVRDAYESLPSEARQEYVNVTNHMNNLRARMKQAMLDFIKLTTPETTQATAITWMYKPSTDKKAMRVEVVQNPVSSQWEIRDMRGQVVQSAATREALTDLTPIGERELAEQRVKAKFNSIKGPYAPLTRFGKFGVTVHMRDPQAENGLGERLEYRKFENEQDAKEYRDRKLADGFSANIELDQEHYNARGELPSGFMAKLSQTMVESGLDANTVNELQDQFARIWVSFSPEANAMKYNLQRKGVAGFSEDMLRGYLRYTQSHGKSISFLERGFQIRQQFLDMDTTITSESRGAEGQDLTEVQDLVNTLKKHEGILSGERVSPWAQQLSKLPFLWYLTSPSVYLVQSSQPYMIAAPRIGVKYGLASALGAISRHYGKQLSKKDGELTYSNQRLEKFGADADRFLAIEAMPDVNSIEQQIKSGKMAEFKQSISTLSAEDQMLLGLKIASKRGAIDITLSHEALDIIQNGDSSLGNKLMNHAAFFMRTSELMSRKATFAAAFELATTKGNTSFDEATNYATGIVLDTLYDYSKSNRPVGLTGSLGRVLGQFRVFQLHTIMKLTQLAHDSFATQFEGESEGDWKQRRQDARTELVSNVGMSMAFAGVAGIPMVGMVTGLANILNALFGSDDEPWDADTELRRALLSLPGGSVLAKGLPALVGMDISRRVGMGSMFDIIQGQPPENLKGTALAAWYTSKLAGPIQGTVSDLFKAQEKFTEGDWAGALKAGSPKAVKDMVRAYSAATEGVTSSNGKMLIGKEEVNLAHVALMLVGINPAEVSLATAKNIDIQRLGSSLDRRKQILTKQFTHAVESDDYDAIHDAVQAISKFNETNPEFGIHGTDLSNAVKNGLKLRMGIPTKREAKLEQKLGE